MYNKIEIWDVVFRRRDAAPAGPQKTVIADKDKEKTDSCPLLSEAAGKEEFVMKGKHSCVHSRGLMKKRWLNAAVSLCCCIALGLAVSFSISGTYEREPTPAVWIPTATKEISGREFKAGDVFTLDLTADPGNDAVGYTLPADMTASTTAVSGTTDTLSFAGVTFTRPGAYIFRIAEEGAGTTTGGLTYTTDVSTVVVYVANDGSGTLTATESYMGAGADGHTFDNSYESKGTWVPTVIKELSGKPITNGQFEFQLYDSDMNPIETGTCDADGYVTMNSIEFNQDDLNGDVTAAKTYYVREIMPSGASDSGDGTYTLGGITYSNRTMSIQLTLTDNGDGTIGVAANTPVIANSYHSSVSWTPTAEKVLKGKELAAGQFSFVLKDSAGNVLQTVTNDADGSINFDPITYTQDDIYNSETKTYKTEPITYTIEEVNTGAAGISYDDHIKTVSVSLSDNGNGTITAVPQYTNGNTFTNEYNDVSLSPASENNDDGAITPQAATTVVWWTPTFTKTLEGEPLVEGQFTFQLFTGEIERLRTTTNTAGTEDYNGTHNATGNVIMLPWDLSIEDMHGQNPATVTFYVRELQPRKPGISYDDHYPGNYRPVTVTLSFDANGNLVATQEPIVFNNEYHSKGKWTPRFSKTLNGLPPEAGKFTFVLKDATTGAVIETATNNANGSVNFEPIKYTQADTEMGTYDPVSRKTINIPEKEYTIEEVIPDGAVQNADGNWTKDGVIYDGHAVNAVVRLIDNRDGTITVTPTYTGNTIFKNTTGASLVITKKVTGTMSDVNKQFGFTVGLKNSNGTADAHSYSYQVWSMGADETKGGTDDTKVTTEGKSGTIADNGTFTLKHDEYIVISDFPVGEKVLVTENDATDYTTSIHSVFGDVTVNSVAGAKYIAEQTIVADAEGVVNRQDFVNNKEAVPPTGIILEYWPYILAVLLVAGIGTGIIVHRVRTKKYNYRHRRQDVHDDHEGL